MVCMANPNGNEAALGLIDWLKTVGSIGGFAGIVTLIWRLIDLFGSYVFLEVSAQVDRASGLVRVKTILENKSLKAKKVSAAFLLISPQSDRVEDVFEALLGTRYEDDREVVARVADEMKDDLFCLTGRHDKGCALIPLTYYIWENSDVGDERLAFEAVIRVSDFPCNEVYAARFYIHGQGRLHRVVHTTFDTIAQT